MNDRHGRPHGQQHLAREPRPVLERAAVGVGAGVDQRVEELLEQVPAVRRDLDAVETAALQPAGHVGEALDDGRQLVGRERHRHLHVDALRQV